MPTPKRSSKKKAQRSKKRLNKHNEAPKSKRLKLASSRNKAVKKCGKKTKVKKKPSKVVKDKSKTVILNADRQSHEHKLDLLEQEKGKIESELVKKDKILEKTKIKEDQVKQKLNVLLKERKMMEASNLAKVEELKLTHSELVKNVEDDEEELIKKLNQQRDRETAVKQKHEEDLQTIKQTQCDQRKKLKMEIKSKKANALFELERARSMIAELEEHISKMRATQRVDQQRFESRQAAALMRRALMSKRIEELETLLGDDEETRNKLEDLTAAIEGSKRKFEHMAQKKDEALKVIEKKLESFIACSSVRENGLCERVKELGKERLKVASLSEEIAKLREKFYSTENSLSELRRNLVIVESKKIDFEQKLEKLKFQRRVSYKLNEQGKGLTEKVKKLKAHALNLEEQNSNCAKMHNEKISRYHNHLRVLDEKLKKVVSSTDLMKAEAIALEQEGKFEIEKLTRVSQIQKMNFEKQGRKINDLETKLHHGLKTVNVVKTKKYEKETQITELFQELQKTVNTKTREIQDLRKNIADRKEKLRVARKAVHDCGLKIKRAKSSLKDLDKNHCKILKSKDAELQKSKNNVEILAKEVKLLKDKVKNQDCEMDLVKTERRMLRVMEEESKDSQASRNQESGKARILESEKGQLQMRLVKTQTASNELKNKVIKSQTEIDLLNLSVKKMKKKIEALNFEISCKDEQLQSFRAQSEESKKRMAEFESTITEKYSRRKEVEAKALSLDMVIAQQENILGEVRDKIDLQNKARKSYKEDHKEEIEGYEEAIRDRTLIINELNTKTNACTASTPTVATNAIGPPPMIPPSRFFEQ